MTRKEAEEQGFEILDFDEAIKIIAGATFRNSSGVNGMSRGNVQDWFKSNDGVMFDWQLEG